MARRNLALKRRDVYGISPVDMVVVKSLSECLMNITKLKKHLNKKRQFDRREVNTH